MGLKGDEGPETTLREQFTAAAKPVDQLETIVEQFGYFDRLPEVARSLGKSLTEFRKEVRHLDEEVRGPVR